MTRRAGIGTVDQLIYSLNNFALTVLVAHSSSVSTFGMFSVIIASFLMISAINRGLTSETYTVRFTIRGGGLGARVEAACVSCSIALAVVVASVSVILALIVHGTAAASLIFLAALLPGLLVQDTCRYIAIAQGRPSVALLSDVLSNLVFGAIVAFLVHESIALSATALLAAWGIGAALGAVYGLVTLRIWPTVMSPLDWLSDHRSLSLRFASENLLTQANQQGSTYIVAAAAGFGDAAALRAAQTIFVPPSIFIFGIQTASTPELVRLAHSSTFKLTRVVVLMAAGCAVVQAIWFALVMAIPTSIGEELFGPTWLSAHPLLVAWGIAQVVTSTGVAPFVALRAMGAAGVTLSTRVGVITVNLVAMVVGALVAGAEGVAIAYAVASPVQSGLWWRAMHRGLADHRGTRQAAVRGVRWHNHLTMDAEVGIRPETEVS